jgi:S1-C subfamily serine protease
LDEKNNEDFEKQVSMDDTVESTNSRYYVEPSLQTSRRKKKNTSLVTIIVVALISAMIGGTVGAYISSTYLYGQNSSNQNIPQNIEIVTKGGDMNIIPAVVKKAMPSVVGITTVSVQQNPFFGTQRGEGVGTGVIIDNRGYILTNAHVVNEGQAEEVKVLLYDGRNLRADVLWNDPVLDLAVVKVQADNLPVAILGNSDELVVGDLAIAIGNPLGLTFERTVTSGIISGLERTIPLNQFESIDGLIQTDASINPGNSGGPLLNSDGEVIGINTAKIQTGEGLGFAIPINMAKPIVDEFEEKGEFRKAYLGIKGVDVAQYIATYGNNLGTKSGVYVYEVLPGTPVYKAGMQGDDVILAMNDKKIESMGQLVKGLYEYRPGDKIKVDIMRDGKKEELQVVLEATPKG